MWIDSQARGREVTRPVGRRPGISTVLLRNVALIFKREPWWAEFWSAMTALSWAGLSYWSVEALREWPSMRILTEIGSDEFWHFTGFVLGLAQLLFLLSDRRWLRWGAAVALCWFWAVLTIGVWVAVPWAPGVAVYAGWCGINVFSILRLLRAPLA